MLSSCGHPLDVCTSKKNMEQLFFIGKLGTLEASDDLCFGIRGHNYKVVLDITFVSLLIIVIQVGRASLPPKRIWVRFWASQGGRGVWSNYIRLDIYPNSKKVSPKPLSVCDQKMKYQAGYYLV